MKVHYRQTDLQSVSCSPKESLSQSQHSSVDTLLKDLRTCSRRLQITLELHSDEAQVLERLYYKGNNQHRGALFWRRVAEVRRYSSRLGGIRIDNVVETLRRSFFGEGPHDNPKLTRGSWTYFPDKRAMLFAVERLSASSALVTKMNMRLIDACRCFTLAMQSGAFLHLVLTLLSVVSRLQTICIEVLEALQATSNTICDILKVAHEIGWPVHEVGREGCTLAVSTSEDAAICNEQPSGFFSTLTEAATNDPSTTIKHRQLSVRRTAIKDTSSDDVAKIQRENKHRIKKRTVKDEIDDIFGF